jgi:hypothetical protein
VVNEVLGKRLENFEARLTASLRFRSIVVNVIEALVDTLPTLLISVQLRG